MCELFAISSKNKQTINKELNEFFSHSTDHPHGWGLALLEKNHFSIKKEPIRAIDSLQLKEILQKPISSHVALAHIRLATIGNLSKINCHPFMCKDISQRKWTLIHNGTIFECDALQPYVSKQNGSTDSERILLYIIDQINQKIMEKGCKLNDKERFEIIDQFVTMASNHNKLNLIIYDGDVLYAHTNYANSLHQKVTDQSVYFSTQPLNTGSWELAPFCQLVAYRQEKLIYKGTKHTFEYHVNTKKLEQLFSAFSEL